MEKIISFVKCNVNFPCQGSSLYTLIEKSDKHSMHCVFGMFLEGVTFKEFESRFSNIKDSYMAWLGCIVMQ